MKKTMEGSPICKRCGLKAVRHDLEQQGIVMHFCDDCYWGVPEEEASSGQQEVAGEAPMTKRKTA